MNTLTDAQVVVSDDVVSLLDRLDAGTAGEAAAVQGEREALETLAENGFLVRHLASERAALESYFAALPRRLVAAAHHDPHDAPVQFRLRLLLPGRARRLRAAGRADVDRHRRAGRGVDCEAGRRGAAAPPGAHLLRGRAAAERAGDVRNRRPVLEARRVARRHAVGQHHHQRPAAHAPGRRVHAAARVDGREGHAGRRPRDARPHAPSAGRPGHFRPDHRERPARGAACARHHRRQLRHGNGRPVPGAARFPQGAGLRGAHLQGGIQADHQAGGPDSSERGHSPQAGGVHPAAAERQLHDRCRAVDRPCARLDARLAVRQLQPVSTTR